MITGAIRSQIDQIWNAFWSGGIDVPGRKFCASGSHSSSRP
jgi:hypothetical protein